MQRKESVTCRHQRVQLLHSLLALVHRPRIGPRSQPVVVQGKQRCEAFNAGLDQLAVSGP